MILDLPRQTVLLLRGDARQRAGWVADPAGAPVAAWAVVIVLGAGAYGGAIGLWRAPLQGLFVAVKMPLLIFLTLISNGLLNGMVAALLGSGLGFRQTALAIGQSFALFSLIVGGLAPVAAFFGLILPGVTEPGGSRCYLFLLLTHTTVIAFGGVLSTLRLLQMLEVFCARGTARLVLIGWLAGNLFVGAQLSYTLRPFFGTPSLGVQFLRPDPFRGNFYEAVFNTLRGVLTPRVPPPPSNPQPNRPPS
jgi:hypothetical protein